jgi:hypothetical protein
MIPENQGPTEGMKDRPKGVSEGRREERWVWDSRSWMWSVREYGRIAPAKSEGC